MIEEMGHKIRFQLCNRKNLVETNLGHLYRRLRSNPELDLESFSSQANGIAVMSMFRAGFVFGRNAAEKKAAIHRLVKFWRAMETPTPTMRSWNFP